MLFNRPYDDQSQLKVAMETQCKFHIQNLIKERKLEMAVSYMLRYECSQNPFEMRKNTIFEFMNEHTHIYVGDRCKKEIEEKARKIMESSNLSMPVLLPRRFMQNAAILYLRIRDC